MTLNDILFGSEHEFYYAFDTKRIKSELIKHFTKGRIMFCFQFFTLRLQKTSNLNIFRCSWPKIIYLDIK
jgi:hypothetical protein